MNAIYPRISRAVSAMIVSKHMTKRQKRQHREAEERLNANPRRFMDANQEEEVSLDDPRYETAPFEEVVILDTRSFIHGKDAPEKI